MTMTPDEWLKNEFTGFRRRFEQGDYSAFMQGLLVCCRNDYPLPDWIASVVISQAETVFADGSTGPGKHGNWRAMDAAIQIEKIRADMVAFHLGARQKRGRAFVSAIAKVFEYGREISAISVNIVTRNDVFEYVSRKLRGTPARGSAAAIEASYKESRRKPGGE